MGVQNEREKNLLKKKKEVEGQLKKLDKSRIDFGDDVDPDEETDESEAATNKLGLMQMLKDRLRGILKALDDLRKQKK